MALLHREQQLGHHVPVDAPEPLEGEETPAPAGEAGVMKHILPDRDRGRPLNLVEPERHQPRGEFGRIRDVGMEVAVTVDVHHDDVGGAGRNPRCEAGTPRRPVGRQPVSLEIGHRITVGLEEITSLVFAIERAGPQSSEEFEGGRIVEQLAGEDGDLPLEHEFEVVDLGTSAQHMEPVVGVVHAVWTAVGPNGVVDELAARGQHPADHCD